METMQRVIEVVNENSRISYEDKIRLVDIISDFHIRFTSVSLKNLCKNLRMLQGVEFGSKLIYTQAYEYSPADNRIYMNKEKQFDPDVDLRHSMMKAVLKMITQNSIYYGFNNGNNNLEALNEGFCEILANNLVGNETGQSDFEDEQILVNFIGKSIGYDVFKNAFFGNNPDLLMKELLAKCGSVEKLNAFLSQVNNNMHTRKASGKSKLFHLQAQAMSMFEIDKDYLLKRGTMEAFSDHKYVDVDELDDLVRQQTMVWTRGGK